MSEEQEIAAEEQVEQEHFANFQQMRDDAEVYRQLRIRADAMGYPTVSHALDALDDR